MKRVLIITSALMVLALTAFAGAHAAGLSIPNAIPAPEVITTFGPDGEVATWYDELHLTAEEVEQVRSMNLRACYELVTESEWSRANLLGFQDAARELNIDVVGIASAELDPIRQKNNMENFAALNCDIITAQPQELDIAASTFDPLVERGVQLVFLSNVPTGYEPGVHYVSALTDSLYDMGVDAADLMAEAIGYEGDIITITVAGVSYVTNTRDAAFKETIEKKYPNIRIVADGGFQGLGEAGTVASGLLTRYPNVKGIYVSFSNPAVSVLEAVRGLGRDDVAIVTMDLDSVAALDMVQDGNVKGIAVDLAYAMGYGRAILGAYGAIGKPAPKYVTSPSFKVTKENLVEGWNLSFGVDPPAEVMRELNR